MTLSIVTPLVFILRTSTLKTNLSEYISVLLNSCTVVCDYITTIKTILILILINIKLFKSIYINKKVKRTCQFHELFFDYL